MLRDDIDCTLGGVLQDCLRASKQAWLEKEKARRESDYAWTQDVLTTHLSSQLKHGGLADVQVSILCKQPWKSTVDFYKLRYHAEKGWFCADRSLDL